MPSDDQSSKLELYEPDDGTIKRTKKFQSQPQFLSPMKGRIAGDESMSAREWRAQWWDEKTRKESRMEDKLSNYCDPRLMGGRSNPPISDKH